MRRIFRLLSRGLFAAGASWPLIAQTPAADMQRIMERLDRLERQNSQLLEEVRQLKQQIAAREAQVQESPQPSVSASAGNTTAQESPSAAEPTIEQRRIEELAQSKVEASQRFPLRLTGMVLFNGFMNSRGSAQFATTAPDGTVRGSGGGTLNQSIVGLDFYGPQTFLGGKVRGSVRFQLFNYGDAIDTATANPNYEAPALRLRTGSIEIDWKSRTLSFSQDKPLVAVRNPDSLSEVGIPPLSGAGNLWLWQPQVRFEQRFRFNDNKDTIRAQTALFATSEYSGYPLPAFVKFLEPVRPSWQGRLSVEHRFNDETWVEIAPVFHYSSSHFNGHQVDSKLIGFDTAIRPVRFMELTGAFFDGQNVANLGGLGQGFVVSRDGVPFAVHSRGGWGQLAWFATDRLTFHTYAGTHHDRAHDLFRGGISRNIAYAANLYYRLAPNVLLGFEAEQTRTRYTTGVERLRNHYDLALAYLF